MIDYKPTFVLIKEAMLHDRIVARIFNLKPSSIVAFDRPFNDYKLFNQWTVDIFFVTRQKEHAVFQVIENRIVPQHRAIISDQIVRLAGVKAEK